MEIQRINSSNLENVECQHNSKIDDKVSSDSQLRVSKINLLIMIGILGCFLIFSFLGYFIGREVAISHLYIEKQKDSSLKNSITQIFNNNDVVQPTTSCMATFTSKYLKLSFDYNSCEWNLHETKKIPEQGVYSEIVATHKSNYRLIVQAESLGMGGGYGVCIFAKDIKFLDNELIRVEDIRPSRRYYFYLNSMNEYGIKGNSGKHGEETFKYNLTVPAYSYEDVNICWRTHLVNAIPILQQKETSKGFFSELHREISVFIDEENLDNEDFLNSADVLAISIFSSVKDNRVDVSSWKDPDL